MSNVKRILVTLATGKQGSGVVRALAAANSGAGSPSSTDIHWIILAVTRNANSSKAKQLGSLPGVKFIEGTLSDPEALFDESRTGGLVYGVFSAQQGVDNPDGGVKGEVMQGKALADAAVKAGVQHFVYSGTDFGGVANTNVPQFESKRVIEDYITATYPSLSLTILRPATFMENFDDDNMKPFAGKLVATLITRVTIPMQLIACSDIGAFAALAFQDPEKYNGQIISLAGDALTGKQILDQYKEVIGKPMPQTPSFLAVLSCLAVKELRAMFAFFNKVGYAADITDVRRQYPEVMTFRKWLETEFEAKQAT